MDDSAAARRAAQDESRALELRRRLETLTGEGAEALAREHGYERCDDGSVSLSESDWLTLQRTLLERVHCKRLRDFDGADVGRDVLRAAGVFVDDRSRTYRCGVPPAPVGVARDTRGGDYARGDYARDDDGSAVLSDADAAAVEAMFAPRVFSCFTPLEA